MKKSTKIACLAVGAILVASVVLAFIYYYDQAHAPTPRYDDEWSGYQIVAGNNSASDGRLVITLNNYHFTSGGDVYANVTFQNVGNGATFAQPSFIEITNGISNYSNGELYDNESFPGEFPNMTLPTFATYGGVNLPAHSSSTYWLVFNFQFADIGSGSGYAVKQFMGFERGYGGTYDGQGGYSCPCGNEMVEFIILPSSSATSIH